MTPVLILVVVDMVRRSNKTRRLEGDGGHNSASASDYDGCVSGADGGGD